MSFLPKTKSDMDFGIGADGPEVTLGIGAGPIGGVEIKFGVDPKTGKFGPREQNTRIGPFNTRIYEDGCDIIEERYYEMLGEKIVIDRTTYWNTSKCGPEPKPEDPKPGPKPPGSPSGIYPPPTQIGSTCPQHIVWMSPGRGDRMCHAVVHGPVEFYFAPAYSRLTSRYNVYGQYEEYWLHIPAKWWFSHQGPAVYHNWLWGGVNVGDRVAIIECLPGDNPYGLCNDVGGGNLFTPRDFDTAASGVIVDRGYAILEPASRMGKQTGLIANRDHTNTINVQEWGIRSFNPLISITGVSIPGCGSTPPTIIPPRRLAKPSSSCCCCKEETKK